MDNRLYDYSPIIERAPLGLPGAPCVGIWRMMDLPDKYRVRASVLLWTRARWASTQL